MKNVARQSRALLAAIVDSSDDAIISKNLNGIITSWNKGAQRIFGYTPEEAIGRSIAILIPPERLDEEPKILDKIRKGESIEHYETIRRTKQGALLNISLCVSPVKDSDGTIIGASKIARDITEQRQAEQALAQAKAQLQCYADNLEKQIHERTQALEKTVAELEAFSYSLSHDMRSPVRAIQSFSETVLSDYSGNMDPDGIDLLKRTIRSAQRMDKLITDLFAFTHLSRAAIKIEPVDVDKLVRCIIQERVEFQPPRAEITIEGALPLVQGSESFLTQCVTNLLENAVKFVARDVKPRVRIYSDQNGSTVRLWFEDNGIGITDEEKRLLFQMFQRIHAETYPGTGLGLALVRKAAERMGGQAGVESQPGQGSRFWLQLKSAGTQ